MSSTIHLWSTSLDGKLATRCGLKVNKRMNVVYESTARKYRMLGLRVITLGMLVESHEMCKTCRTLAG